MAGDSFFDVLTATGIGQVDPTRLSVLLATERHVPGLKCPPWGYPSRAVRTASYLYIRNYEPNRWPMGSPFFSSVYANGTYGSVDASPTKTFMVQNPGHPAVAPLYLPTFGLRPAVELYDLQADPGQLVNVAGLEPHEGAETVLAAFLETELLSTADPRATGGGSEFDSYPYFDPHSPPPLLTTDVDEISAITGGAQTLTLDATPTHAGKLFLMLGSSAGAQPGFALWQETLIGLNPSPYFNLTLLGASPFLSTSLGQLDANGRAILTVGAEESIVHPGLLGLVLHHAYVVLEVQDLGQPASGFVRNGSLASPQSASSHSGDGQFVSPIMVSNSCSVQFTGNS